MALSSVRFRRPLQSVSSSLFNLGRQFSATTAISSSSSLSSATVNSPNPRFDLTRPHHHNLSFQSRNFRSSSAWLSSARSSFGNKNFKDEISPDTILFEGCDYNHWLITMDFPKDPAPTREEMIETYLQTLAKVVGSYEEAKKKMYALSTTTYVGFQCLVTEEMSEKFKELPGVVFVLPDSYIDPVAKEYGGDKYENGVITPRPPPAQYGRGRYTDRNREVNRRPRGPMPDQQASPSYGNQGPFYRDMNTGQQQNPALQPSPVTAGDRGDQMPQHQPTYGQNQQGHYNPQGGRIQPEQRDYMSPRQNEVRGDNRNYSPSQSGIYRQGGGGNYGQTAGPSYGQGAGGNYEQGFGIAHRQETPMAGGNYGQGARGNYGQGVGSAHRQETSRVGENYGQGAGGSYGQGAPMAGGNYGQGARGNYGGNYGQGLGSAHRQEIPSGGENYGQGAGGNYGQGVGVNHLRETPMAGVNHGHGAGGNFGQRVGPSHRQETGSGYGQNYPGHGGEHMQAENGNYAAMGNTGADQGTF